MYILIEIDSLIQYILTTFSLSQLLLAYHHPTLPSPGSIYQKSQRHTCSHCKNPTKTIKLTTITRMQRTWSRPMLAGCLLLQCLCAYVRLLSWFTGSCSPGVLHNSWLLQSFLSFLIRVPDSCGDGLCGDLQFRLSAFCLDLGLCTPRICCWRKPLRWWLDKASILGLSTIQPPVFGHLGCIGHELCLFV